jgi:hypothetical protein
MVATSGLEPPPPAFYSPHTNGVPAASSDRLTSSGNVSSRIAATISGAMVLRSKPEAQIIPRTNALLDMQFAPELLCQQRYELQTQ